jgi:hypothetical protein
MHERTCPPGIGEIGASEEAGLFVARVSRRGNLGLAGELSMHLSFRVLYDKGYYMSSRLHLTATMALVYPREKPVLQIQGKGSG